MSAGDALPDLVTPVPGPASREMGRRLAAVESRNITRIGDDGPIFWAEAAGANVRDVDGNLFIDLTAGFGVAAAGHANRAVVRAIAEQAASLPHALGDVHPAEVKVRLLERLARIAPGDLSVAILSANGSDAVESALKTALLATGRPGLIAFRGGYHGLGYGALAVTWASRFREPFRAQLYPGVEFAPFPDAGEADPAGAVDRALEAVRTAARGPAGGRTAGAVIVEPIQGRAGIVVPPPDFLPSLHALCRELDLVLILDEVYTGFGRTGRWFACEHDGVVPDVLVVGKGLAGGLPLSAAIGSQALMAAWPESTGEAIHTSTFLGNPIAAAAALAHLDEIEERRLVDRSAELGGMLAGWLGELVARHDVAVRVRGRGLMQALVLGGPDASGLALAVAQDALREGVILLSEGDALAFTPPLVVTADQLEHALDVVDGALGRRTG